MLPFFKNSVKEYMNQRFCNRSICPSNTKVAKQSQWAIFNMQLSSVALLCLTLYDPMNCSTPGFPVHHQLLELTQIQVYRVGDAFQTSHPLSSPFPFAINLSKHQGLFQWVSSSYQVAKILEFWLQHQSFKWTLIGGKTKNIKMWFIKL